MINQSNETNVSVSIDEEILPAVTAINIELERSVNGGVVDTEDGTYRVTIKRYLPVGVDVKNLFELQKFEIFVVDSWRSHIFLNCEWVRIERNLDKNGVYETMVAQTKAIQVY